MPAQNIDLHSHSTVSDGTLSPRNLIARARTAGVHTLALTDHDTTAGLNEAASAAGAGLSLVPGVEISVSWENRTLHIVGLHIDPAEPGLCKGLARLQDERAERAERIAARLEKAGVHGALEAARHLTSQGGDRAVPTRTHFARVLVERNRARDMKRAFKHFLKPGRPAFVQSRWAGLEEAIAWIHSAGGQAVLAHPLRYGMTGAWLRRTLTAFSQAGGDGLEVACGTSTPTEVKTAAGHALHFELLASAGSDYHGPENPWVQLGRLPDLPANLRPIWRDWPNRPANEPDE